MRTRITIDADLIHEAVEYAADDNRTFSELVSNALEQYMHRYPKQKTDLSLEKQVQIMRKEINTLTDKMEAWHNEDR